MKQNNPSAFFFLLPPCIVVLIFLTEYFCDKQAIGQKNGCPLNPCVFMFESKKQRLRDAGSRGTEGAAALPTGDQV